MLEQLTGILFLRLLKLIKINSDRRISELHYWLLIAIISYHFIEKLNTRE